MEKEYKFVINMKSQEGDILTARGDMIGEVISGIKQLREAFLQFKEDIKPKDTTGWVERPTDEEIRRANPPKDEVPFEGAMTSLPEEKPKPEVKKADKPFITCNFCGAFALVSKFYKGGKQPKYYCPNCKSAIWSQDYQKQKDPYNGEKRKTYER